MKVQARRLSRIFLSSSMCSETTGWSGSSAFDRPLGRCCAGLSGDPTSAPAPASAPTPTLEVALLRRGMLAIPSCSTRRGMFFAPTICTSNSHLSTCTDMGARFLVRGCRSLRRSKTFTNSTSSDWKKLVSTTTEEVMKFLRCFWRLWATLELLTRRRKLLTLAALTDTLPVIVFSSSSLPPMRAMVSCNSLTNMALYTSELLIRLSFRGIGSLNR
mmetsp:Transcript_14707/g.32432  ORF Transcript_14707/g.32432 Transcript_14707/m.32432 type:complete len:216 (+) Transcript_14707:2082-2729(+)